jgi:alpha-glucosidase
MRPIFTSMLLLACGFALPLAAQETLRSPDGNIVVALTTGSGLGYSITRNGETVIAPSSVGLSFVQEDPLALPRSLSLQHLGVLKTDHRDGVDDYRPVAGKTSHVHDAYREVTIHAQERDGLRRKLDWIIRAYNAGVALRMVLPQQENMTTVHLAGEGTQFLFPANYKCTGYNPGTVGNSHEGEFDDVDADHIRPHNLYDDPLVCHTSKGTAFAIVESDVDNYPAMYLSGLNDGRLGVQVHLPGRVGGDGAVKTPMTAEGVKTPWRVVMMADRPEKLLEANLIEELAAPSRVPDTSWIRPGFSSWDWWSGPNLPGFAGVGLNDATYKQFIDLAQKMHLPYMLIDEGWAKNGKGDGYMLPDVDVTQTNPDVHLPELVAYAKERGVGLWLWLHWQSIDRQMEPAMAWYQQLGIRGIKVDFMDRQDQEIVDFYHRLLTKAADHHLMVDLHGAYPPRGLVRTYPNFLTQEGVMGAEYNKWSRRETAEHNVRLAYTRALTGPMDYTPGGWNNVTAAEFHAQNTAPEVMTTRAQQLAMYVVYTSPFACVSDSPSAYTDAGGKLLPGLEVFAKMPTTWDETRAIGGDFAKWIAVARRSGKTWYVGVMNDGTARDVTLDLSVLHATNVQTYTDGDSPKDLHVGSGVNGALHLAADGGALLILQTE